MPPAQGVHFLRILIHALHPLRMEGVHTISIHRCRDADGMLNVGKPFQIAVAINDSSISVRRSNRTERRDLLL
jgi:hypothetical protein